MAKIVPELHNTDFKLYYYTSTLQGVRRMTNRHLLPNRLITTFGQMSEISQFGKRLQNMYDKETKLEKRKTITKKFKRLGKKNQLKNIKNTLYRTKMNI